MRPLSTVALSTLVASLASASCVIQGPSIGKFDINGLRQATDYQGINNPDGGDVTLNFCGAVTSDPVAAGQGAGAYIQDSRGPISLGKYSTIPQYHNEQLSVTYKDGAACPKSNARRSSLIYLQCDKSWSTSQVSLIDSIDDCVYVFTMKTPHACSQRGGGFFSAIWSITVFLFWILLAVAAGVFVYTRFVARKASASTGFGPGGGGGRVGEQVGEAVGFVKDMVIIVGVWALDTVQTLVSKVQNRRRESGSGAYNPYAPATPGGGGGGARSASASADYSSSAWRATTRTGPPEPPAKDERPREREEETMPGLAGGGSLLDDDDDEDDDEGEELTMGGTGGIKV
ncbi:hypothetical protein JCM11491_005383 [Sporobolomyces phaffii]